MTQTSIVAGSLSAIARDTNTTVAESFINSDALILCDVSGSMSAPDARGGQTRYAVLIEELSALQARMPGKLAIVAFSTGVDFCPGGVPTYEGGGTNLHTALSFVKVADGCVTFTLISDGIPSDALRCLKIAATFKSNISTVYVGPEGGEGEAFLRQLAAASGGQSVTSDRAYLLGQTVERLLLETRA